MPDPPSCVRVPTLRQMSPPLPMQFALPSSPSRRSRGLPRLVACVCGLAFATLSGLAGAQDPRDGGRPAKGQSLQRGRDLSNELSHVPVTAAVPPGPAAPPPGAGGRENPWRRVSPEPRPALADGLAVEPREPLRAARRAGTDAPPPGTAADPVRRMTPEQRGELRRQIREAHQERRAARLPRRD
jgi:hypothetical protein